MQRGAPRVIAGGPSPLAVDTAGVLDADPYRRSSGTLRGLLKMLQGQIPSAASLVGPTALTASTPYNGDNGHQPSDAVVSVYRYHGPTLRESQKALLKKKTKRKSRTAVVAASNNGEGGNTGGAGGAGAVPLLRHFTPFANAVQRHKFVAFFVVQGVRNAGGTLCYSAHELKLRSILATDYHDAMMTFVLDAGSSHGGRETYDEECGNGGDDDDEDGGSHHPFCRGTGFGLFPTTPLSVPTVLSVLNVTKIPAVVVLDAGTGRTVAHDAILAIERNDGHGVINRWQSGKPGLSPWQQVGAVATCDCSHGPCCAGSGGGGGCCTIQ